MTEIGKMIINEAINKGKAEGEAEGIAKGKAEGIKDGKTETLVKLLTKKFGRIPENYLVKLKKLSEDAIDIITVDIFDIKSISEIEKYFD